MKKVTVIKCFTVEGPDDWVDGTVNSEIISNHNKTFETAVAGYTEKGKISLVSLQTIESTNQNITPRNIQISWIEV